VDISGAYASEEEEPCSSYGTGESEPEEAGEMLVSNEGDVWSEPLEHMKGAIAAMHGTQFVILEKLSALEKLVSCVQEDTTWLRGDVRVVHEVVEKLSDYVSTLSNTVAVVEGMPELRSPDVSAWGAWTKDEANARQRGRSESTRVEEIDRVLLGEEERNHLPLGGESLVLETQMYDSHTGLHSTPFPFGEEGEGGGLSNARDSGTTISLPTEE